LRIEGIIDRLARLKKGRWGVLVLVGLLAYFGYHALHGRFGLYSWLDLSDEIVTVREEVEVLGKERRALEHLVTRLSPDANDPDLLEQEVRRTLGYIREDEVIILMPPVDGETVT
jgi:cell division protein FtsB